MASVNKAIIVGNLGKDPEVRSMPNGDAVTNITVATTETRKDKGTGEKREATGCSPHPRWVASTTGCQGTRQAAG